MWWGRWYPLPVYSQAHEKGEENQKPKPPLFRLSPTGDVFIVVLALVAVVVPSLIIWELWLAISLGALFLIGAGLWRIVGFSAQRFFGLGLAVFISVPLFGAVTMTMRNLLDPQVQAMALIRKTDGPDEAIQGIYVSETSDRIYFANVATEGCSKDTVSGSGRLLWVPKKEVVAMSVGPLEDLGDARKSALEMAYALTPSVETPSAGTVSLTPPEEQSTRLLEAAENRRAKEVEEGISGLDQRLQNPGPAVRPNFGSGLSLFPEGASPGEVVELRLSEPKSKGFGQRPEGRVVRLNGVPIAPVREKTTKADRAEYALTTDGIVLPLDKLGGYGLDDGKPRLLKELKNYLGQLYVKLGESTDAVVVDPALKDNKRFLKIEDKDNDGQYRLDDDQMVKVKDQDPEPLQPALRRQAWSNDLIRFKVPDNASSGVVTVECEQLAGSPLLRVAHAPVARITARMKQNSLGISLDSSRTGDPDEDEDKEKITRRWTVSGLPRGHREEISTRLLPRTQPYEVKLTVTDEEGNSDSATLRLMRLPTTRFQFDDPEPESTKKIERVANALEESVQAKPPTAIELDGHADQPGTFAYNMRLSMKRDERVGELLLEEAEGPLAEKGIPVREVGFGETCPVDPRPGRRARNRRVDVFVLDEGVTVKPAKGCLPGRVKEMVWHPQKPQSQEKSSDSTGKGSGHS